jgi:hypothetical protein
MSLGRHDDLLLEESCEWQGVLVPLKGLHDDDELRKIVSRQT